MALAHPIRLVHEDGFQTEITEQPDKTLRVLVTAPGGRSWTSERALIEDAIAVSIQILEDQRAAVVLDAGFVSA